MYAIYEMLKRNNSRYGKAFLITSIIFVAVGTLYHCVFAMTAWLYNRLAVYGLDMAKQVSENMFITFIGVAFIAAIAFIALSVEMFLAASEGDWKQRIWILVNPLIIMLLLMIMAAILPQNKVFNGFLEWGQQSVSLFIIFTVFIIKKREDL